MKKLLLIVALAAFGVAQGQGYYYIKKAGTADAFDWLPTTNGSTKIMDKPNNDVMTSSQTLPFSFMFHGNSFGSFKASDNGYITFDATASISDNSNATLPDASQPNNAIFGFWADLELKAAPNAQFPVGIYTMTSGTSPNRIYTIEWFGPSRKGVAIVGNPDAIAFAVRLYEAGGFDIVHGGPYGGSNFKGLVGLQDNGTNATMVTGDTNFTFTAATSIASKDAIVYSFNSGTQPDWDASVTKLNFITDYGMTTIPVTGTLANYGKNGITSFDINYSVDGGATVTKNITGVNIQGSGMGSYNFTA
ncbi:MAG: hypothetical protein EXR21_10365, partial [Flavobacteriaceae bacterium]|nr:hypothetical protein [Flavobacteriaceae bacterium]